MVSLQSIGKNLKINMESILGDRVFQIMVIPYPVIEFEEVDELSESTRGAGGFGSSNTK